MAVYVLIHVFGTVRDELDRSESGKRSYSGWLRRFVADTPPRITEIARLVDLLGEHGWKLSGSPYDCDVMFERPVARELAEQELRRAEIWDRLVKVASPDDDGHAVWREHPEGRTGAPRRRRRVRRPPTREQGGS